MVNGFFKRQGFCLPVNACTGKGRAEKGAEPFIGKEEELALSFFSVFFFRYVEGRYVLYRLTNPNCTKMIWPKVGILAVRF